jgi:hypothetical protein
MAVFWDVALCRLLDIDQRFSGAYSLHYGDHISPQYCISEGSHLLSSNRPSIVRCRLNVVIRNLAFSSKKKNQGEMSWNSID